MRNPGLVIIGLLAGLAWWFSSGASVPGTVDPAGNLAYPGYSFQTLDRFDLKARVLSRRDYRFGREAELSPLDLAVGWGPMADPHTLQAFTISQRNRWYYWKARELPISRADIIAHSANVHIIPASEQIALSLDDVAVGSEVQLAGQLVQVTAPDGWRWRSSLSRTDTGAGSCEVLLLESLRVL